MKFILTFLSLLISNFLFAQNNGPGKQNNTAPSVSAVHDSVKKNEKKVYYVEKRTKPVQNNSRTKPGSQVQKKPLIRKAEKQNKVLSK